MVSTVDAARECLIPMLDAHESTRGLYVKVRGKQLILGRRETLGPEQEPDDDDRVRLTHRGGDSYGLAVMRHTGRWEQTPFSGTLEELLEIMVGTMQHLLADWP